MFIRLYSDIHLEFGDYNIPPLENDEVTTLVLAGDIGVGTSADIFVKRCCEQFADVIYVLGNHEFYQHEYYKVIAAWKIIADDIDNLHFLHDETVVLGGVRFLGSTMWTDMNNEDWFTMQAAKDGMNDYFVCKINIDGQYRKLQPADTTRIHRAAKSFLNIELAKEFDGKTVVVTHHTPSMSLSHPMYMGSQLSHSFHASCENIIDIYSPDIWMFGHTHDCMDQMLGDTRVISNQRGYAGMENPVELGFDSHHIIEV